MCHLIVDITNYCEYKNSTLKFIKVIGSQKDSFWSYKSTKCKFTCDVNVKLLTNKMATCNLEYDKIQTLTVPLPNISGGGNTTTGFEYVGGAETTTGIITSSGLTVQLEEMGVTDAKSCLANGATNNVRQHPLQSSPYNQHQYGNNGAFSSSEDKDLFEWGDSSCFSLASSAEMCRINETLFEAMRSG